MSPTLAGSLVWSSRIQTTTGKVNNFYISLVGSLRVIADKAHFHTSLIQSFVS